MEKRLFMIVSVPTGEAKTQVDEIRETFSKKYFVKQALLNPAHITIVAPFHATSDQIAEISDTISKSYRKIKPFRIIIDGYGFFKKNKVVFLKPQKHLMLSHIANTTETIISTNHEEIKLKKIKDYAPHVTIGYRDLTRKDFSRAFDEYNMKRELISWTIEHIQIWERGNNSWATIYELPLGE